MSAIEAITLDFGNTLVPVPAAGLRAVVQATARDIAEQLGPFVLTDVLAAWDEERARQLREELPKFREVDLGVRVVRVLARLRGLSPPEPDVPWDQDAAAARSDPREVAQALDVYMLAFVEALPPPPTVEPMLARLAGQYRLAILSNWPLGTALDRYADAAHWTRHLSAIVVSQRVGSIKPQPAIFEVARAALGHPPPEAILHVGDDWAADVVGAKRAGWHAGYLGTRPDDSPLPSSVLDASVKADLELEALADLEPALAAWQARGPDAVRDGRGGRSR